MVKLKYVGVGNRRVEWTSMGKTYSYYLVPNKVIEVPPTQALIAQNFAAFEEVKGKKPAKPDPVKVVAEKKLDPVAPPAPVVEEVVDEDETVELEEDTEFGLEVVEGGVEEDDDLDFAAMTKQEICDWLEANGYGTVLKSDHKKDDLIFMAVEHQKSL